MSPFPSTAARPAACLLLAVLASAGHLSADATARLTLRATIFTRTRLTVSTRELRFNVTHGDTAAAAVVDFSAAARTSPCGEVILTVEPGQWLERPGGTGEANLSVSFEGVGDGALDGVLLSWVPAVAGRWVGGGMHSGSLRFRLTAAAPGNYRLPLRFVLSAP